MRHTLALLALVPFTAFTVWLVAEHGYFGFWRQATQDAVSWQVLLDLLLAQVMLFAMLRRDAAARGVRLWPWFVAALGIGSVSTLLYFIYTGLWATPAANHPVSS